jgi:hypothetical protein
MMAILLLPRESMGDGEATDQEIATIQIIREACHISDTETDPQKINKQAACVERATKAQSRKVAATGALHSKVGRVYSISPNTLVDKQQLLPRAIAQLVPEATISAKADQTRYRRNPQAFLQQMHLQEADVCGDTPLSPQWRRRF